MSRPLKIAIIAGEASGDILGAGLIEQILQRCPDATFEGIAKLQAAKQVTLNTSIPVYFRRLY